MMMGFGHATDGLACIGDGMEAQFSGFVGANHHEEKSSKFCPETQRAPRLFTILEMLLLMLTRTVSKLEVCSPSI